MKSSPITAQVVKKVARLARLTLTSQQETKFAKQLSGVLEYISKIQLLKTDNIKETSQVTGLTNVTRDDVVEKERMLTQKEALSNAKKMHNGYFVVDAIFEE